MECVTTSFLPMTRSSVKRVRDRHTIKIHSTSDDADETGTFAESFVGLARVDLELSTDDDFVLFPFPANLKLGEKLTFVLSLSF